MMLAALSYLLGMSCPQGAPKLRFQVDQHGDVLMIGNPLGQECRTDITSPKPIVGTVGDCGTVGLNDSAPDVFWRAEDDGTVNANITGAIPSAARTSATLKLPVGAQVIYARLYWGSHLGEDPTLSISTVTVDRPGAGAFAQAVMATPTDVLGTDGGAGYVYVASADVTTLLQKHGDGAYRVTGPARVSVVNVDVDIQYAAWSMVVFYKLAAAPVRNLALFDGLDKVVFNAAVDVSISGFLVPSGGALSGKLGVIAYEGDVDKNDFLKFNGQPLSDANNPSDNFFNSSRSSLGVPISVVGDLPQLSGTAGSMSGLDLDLVDIGPLLKSGDTSAQITAGSVNDSYFLHALITSVVSTKPVIETTLTYPQGISTRPGDTIEFASTTHNLGNDTGTGIVITHQIPKGLSYMPGSVRLLEGPDTTINGLKSDLPGDDQAEYDPLNHSLRIRIGKSASATLGGSLSPSDKPVVVKFLVRIDDSAVGDIPTQSATAAGSTLKPELAATLFPSGNGTSPAAPTVISVPACVKNTDCTVASPVCDRTVVPAHCNSNCMSDDDCIGALDGTRVCSLTLMKCVQCQPMAKGACTADGPGSVCLASNQCGCMTDADCGGRTCDRPTSMCPYPAADLALDLAIDPVSPLWGEPALMTFNMTNLGPLASAGPLHLTVSLFGGLSIQKIVADSRWHCSVTGEYQLACLYPYPLDLREGAPPVSIITNSNSCLMDSALQCVLYEKILASVSAEHTMDAAPGNNSITRLLPLYTQLAEPVGCAVQSRRADPAALWVAVAAALLLGASVYRGLRRKTARLFILLLICWASGCGADADIHVEIVNWPLGLKEVYLVPTLIDQGQHVFGKTIRIAREHPSTGLVYSEQSPCDLQISVVGIAANQCLIVTGNYLCSSDTSDPPGKLTIRLEAQYISSCQIITELGRGSFRDRSHWILGKGFSDGICRV